LTFQAPASPSTRTGGLPFDDGNWRDEHDGRRDENAPSTEAKEEGTGAFLITAERQALSVALAQTSGIGAESSKFEDSSAEILSDLKSEGDELSEETFAEKDESSADATDLKIQNAEDAASIAKNNALSRPLTREELTLKEAAELTADPPDKTEQDAQDTQATKERSVESVKPTDETKCIVAPAEPNGKPKAGRRPLLEGAFGPYAIECEIARGGVGAVFRACERAENRVVALKVLLDPEEQPELDRERFRRECETARSLSLPGMVRIYAVGEVDGKPYMAMEFVEGRSLDRVIPEKNLSITEALVLMRSVAETLGALHEAGYVHRDVKPANILLDHLGAPKLADFGLVKSLDEVTRLTASGLVCGTPAYMAPEQARGEGDAIDPRADVWALGAVLYELLTGRPPFKADNALRLMLKITREEPPDPRTFNAKIPSDVIRIIRRCLSKKRERRYNNGRELAQDIAYFLEGKPIAVQTQPAMRQVMHKASEYKRLLLTTVAGVAALLFVGAMMHFLFAPEKPEVHLARGRALLARQAPTAEVIREAEDNFRKAAQLDDLCAEAFLGLGQALGARSVDVAGRKVSDPERFREALEQLHRAARLNPKLAGVAHTWAARLHMSAGDFLSEVRERELAVRAETDRASFRHDLAIAYWNAGYRAAGEDRNRYYERASDEFRRTLLLRPDHPKTAEYLRRLKEQHLVRRAALVQPTPPDAPATKAAPARSGNAQNARVVSPTQSAGTARSGATRVANRP
jgi:hypothetical protein